jgi:hypothetical protein
MKKLILLPLVFLSISGISYGQKLNKKDSRKILENVWNYVKTSDTADFRKMWAMDGQQWPYHTVPFDVQQITLNYWDFKSYFDTALIKNLKIDQVDCDTVEYNDPHRSFAKYHITAWFKYSDTYRKGFTWIISMTNGSSGFHPIILTNQFARRNNFNTEFFFAPNLSKEALNNSIQRPFRGLV